MSESNPDETIGYPRGATCPKCQAPLSKDNWCGRCAGRRQQTIGFLLMTIAPVLGFGACSGAIAFTNNVLILVGGCLCGIGPIVGIWCLVEAKDSRKKYGP